MRLDVGVALLLILMLVRHLGVKWQTGTSYNRKVADLSE